MRRLYAEFRRNLRHAEGESSEAVLTALRYAAGALAPLTASPHCAAVRVSDRTLLRRQRARLLERSRDGKSIQVGLELLEDIWTCADLLRDINRRQELRAHDSQLMKELIEKSSRDRADWLANLDRLAGLDSDLDNLTAQLRTSENAACSARSSCV